MMTKIRSKLLEAVGGIDIHDIGEEALVDILVTKIKAQNRRIQELHSESASERQYFYDKAEALRRDRNELRGNPLYGAYGEFYFLGRDNRRYCLSMQGGSIRCLYERSKKSDWMMQQIPSTQWNILNDEEEIGKREI